MPEEMEKLRDALFEKAIEWVDATQNIDKGFPFLDLTIYRTHWWVDGHNYSAISGYGTFGGDKGLLELMIDGNEPIGSLTATEVMRMIEDA